jgi:ApaG protein
MYTATTREIRITVEPSFLEQESRPEKSHFVWAYAIEIANDGTKTVQLISRKWRIVDAMGRVQEVSGPGVVGEQPVLAPGQSFRYTSGVPLNTPSGFMAGSYLMVVEEGGESFEAEVPAFSLDQPTNGRVTH